MYELTVTAVLLEILVNFFLIVNKYIYIYIYINDENVRAFLHMCMDI